MGLHTFIGHYLYPSLCYHSIYIMLSADAKHPLYHQPQSDISHNIPPFYTNYFHLFLIPIWRIIFHRIPKMLLYILSLIM